MGRSDEGGQFIEGFGWVSAKERRRADLFLADLLGQSLRAPQRRARLRAPALEQAESFEQTVPQPLAQRCGFWGPGTVLRTEAEVRDTVVAGAMAERTAWLNVGVLRREGDNAMFGRLVGHWLAVIRDARPDTLTAMQTTALGNLNYGQLLAANVPAQTLAAELTRVRNLLLTGAPGATTPANLAARVDSAVRQARQSRLDAVPWSAVWVSKVVREAGAGVTLGLEAFVNGVHHGRNKLLLPDSAHRVYTFEAHNRQQQRQTGTYLTFNPALRAPQLGDIIVQDRQANTEASCFTFADVPSLSGGRATHGDIVVEVDQGFVVTIGGNVGHSVRRRRYPLDANGRLVVDPTRLFTQENDQGALPAVPAAIVANPRSLHALNTRRIFALLSPVIECGVIPGQQYGSGILV